MGNEKAQDGSGKILNPEDIQIPQKLLKFQSERVDERRKLARELEFKGIKDERVLKCIEIVPRHIFVPENLDILAYEDEPLPIGYGQTISQPFMVALMTENLHLSGSEKVLEIGTGSGYQTTLLALMSFEVITVEYIQQLSCLAMQRLEELGIENVKFIVGDGGEGWKPEAPYDRIIITAALPKFPEPLERQLKEGGIALAPIGSPDEQRLYKIVKVKGKLEMKEICPCRFVPMKGKWGF